ncbi:hypothetical protein GOODEAATRI_029260 [Goodea atripinnis]|uniref:Uncharacterized protein n=1 Tax=Goodea atripinnis TaxID=208336 RepID=A0ABV0MLN7_9TELE
MARIGNSLSVLLLAQSQMLQPCTAPILDDCRQSLRKLPVVPGQLFGPEAERALEHRWQSSQAPAEQPGCGGSLASAWGGTGSTSWDSGRPGEELAPPQRPEQVAEGGLRAGRFSQQHLVYWKTQCRDAWVCLCATGGRTAGRALSKHRLLHWVVVAIALAYESVGAAAPSVVMCHSTRSVSWAALRGMPLGISARQCHGQHRARLHAFTASMWDKSPHWPQQSCLWLLPLPERWVSTAFLVTLLA